MAKDVVLKVEHLYKDFKLPHERQNSLKDWALHFHKPSFERFHALKDINFEVERGDFFGVVGKNGSGKSTLLKIIGGIYAPTKGSVEVNGTLTPFIELGIGFSPELTGRENVFLNGAILGLTRKEVLSKYDEIVGFAEIEQFMDQKLKNYSSGMQVRLAFAIAIQAHNDILLIDEVLAVGDAAFQRKCFNIFKEIKKQGKTVIFVTHSMQNVVDFCNKALLIQDSRVLVQGDPEVVSTEYLRLNNGPAGGGNSSHPGEASKRWGNKRATVSKVSVGNTAKKTIAFTADCLFNSDADNPIIGFSIKDQSGRKIVESNTQWNKLKTGPFVSGQKVRVTWEVANVLTNGPHELTVAIADVSAVEFFDWWEDALQFEVNRPIVTSALVAPAQTISIERKS